MTEAGRPRLDGVVLAGGLGRRMGGLDKGLVDLAGRPLVARVADRLAPQVERLVISANRNLEVYAALGYPVLADDLPDHPGPLAGILAAGQRLTAPWLLAVPCDLPFLPADLARRLLAAALAEGFPVAYAAEPGREHYAVMLLARGLLPDLAAYLAAGGRQVRAWLARAGGRGVPFPDAGDAFRNLNTPEDVDWARRRMNAERTPPAG